MYTITSRLVLQLCWNIDVSNKYCTRISLADFFTLLMTRHFVCLYNFSCCFLIYYLYFYRTSCCLSVFASNLSLSCCHTLIQINSIILLLLYYYHHYVLIISVLEYAYRHIGLDSSNQSVN
jgi:hypothetical protein